MGKTLSTPAVIALCALTILGLVGGWYVLLNGGFIQASRYSREFIHVDGRMALVMAIIEFIMAAIGVAAIVQAQGCAKYWYVIGCGAVLVPPILFVLQGKFFL
jgi:hypothetical protein